MSIRKTKEEFSEEYYLKYGHIYDLSEFEYVNNHTKGIVICPKHGKFEITPKDLLHGVGCKKCANEKKSKNLTKTLDEFVNQYYTKFGKRYDLSNFKYNGNKERGTAICYKHGEFQITPNSLLHGHGCPTCKHEKMSITKDEFVEQYIAKYEYKYDFSEFIYNGNKKEGVVICSKHGKFESTPNRLLQGHGCPMCNESKLEKEVYNLLQENNIEFEHNKRYNFLNKLQLDFYLPLYKIGIECQGKQHFYPIEHFGGQKRLIEQKLKDSQKYDLCKKNNIKLLYYANYQDTFPYEVFTDKNELLLYIRELIENKTN